MYSALHCDRTRRSTLSSRSASVPRLDTSALMRELESEDTQSSDSGWSVGYLDILLLLVTLFAVLMGMAYMRAGDAEAARADEVEFSLPLPTPSQPVSIDPMVVLSALRTRPAPPAPEPEPAAASSEPRAAAPDPAPYHDRMVMPEVAPSSEFDRIARLVANNAHERLELFIEDRQIRVELQDDILFSLGAADLSAEGAKVLDQLADSLKKEDLHLSVEGHTDDLPIATRQFPSNWELSSYRATSVARYLISKGVPAQRIRVSGHADTRPRRPNDTPQNRAANRRVSIVLHMVDAPKPSKMPFPAPGDWANL